MTELAIEALTRAVNENRALIICGSGVSKSADVNAPDWKRLIEAGVMESVGWGFADEKWKTRQLQALEDGDVNEWIAVADLFTEKLGGQDNGHFVRWLERTVGALKPSNRDLLDAIKSLKCPIATTNYDDVLALAYNTSPISWIEQNSLMRVLDQRDTGILHLHGHWKKPETVILGTKSYQKIANNERAQFIQRFLAFKHSLVFVGCSEDGLTDENFGKLKVWLQGWDGLGRDHFHLVEDRDWKPNKANAPIKQIKYGQSHLDLPKFLRSLRGPSPLCPLLRKI